MEFKLTIELGDAAMSSSEDIAVVLRRIANQFEENRYVERGDSNGDYASAVVRDLNGNKVGEWELSGEPLERDEEEEEEEEDEDDEDEVEDEEEQDA